MAKDKNVKISADVKSSAVQRVASKLRAMSYDFGGGVSALTQRLSIANMLGIQMNGQRDLYKVFGYKRVILYRESWQRYRRQDICSRIIDAPVKALWTNPPTVTSTDPAWNAVWNDLVINKGLYQVISRVDKMSGLGDYSVLLVGFDNTIKLEQPVQYKEGRKVLFFQPYDYGCANISKLNADPTTARYMKPELYRVQPAVAEQPKPMGLQPIIPFGVHHSRILHVAENLLSDEVFGNPRIERVWNLLDDLLKVCGGTAETFWLAAYKGFQIDVDKEMDLNEEDEQMLSEELEEYSNQLRRYIRTRGVKINDMKSDIADPKSAFDVLMSLISGATGIPKRILLGSEAGQLASGEDRNNWAERIVERRKDFGEPVILWPLIRMLTEAGVLPQKDGAIVTIKWPDPFQLTPLERAQAQNYTARSAQSLSAAITAQPKLISIEQGQDILGLNEPETQVDPSTLTEDQDQDQDM